MKKNVLAVVALVLVALATSAYKNEPQGFRGRTWGMALPEGWGQVIRTDPRYGGITYYNAPGEDLALGCAKLKSVDYGFWQGILSEVIVNFDGYVNYTCVLKALKEEFGHGIRQSQFVEKYFWHGGVTTVSLVYNGVGKTGSLSLRSEAIRNEQEAWNKAQAK